MAITKLTKLVAFLAIMSSAVSDAAADDWWEPLICPKSDPNAVGGSRETARKVELGDLFFALDAVTDTYADLDSEGDLPPPMPTERLAPNCQWVELSGYFRPVRYHDYRGQLLADVADHYFSPYFVGLYATHFWIQNWADPKTISHDLHNRNVKLRGRVYDQCVAQMQYDRARGELGYRFGGPCHYGENTGMILVDVEVVEVASVQKLIAFEPDLSDVLDEPLAFAKLLRHPDFRDDYQPLGMVESLPLEAIDVVTSWIAGVQEGVEAAIAVEALREDRVDKRFRERIRQQYDHPDGRLGYLNAIDSFAELDPQSADIAFLGLESFDPQSANEGDYLWSGFGCVTLTSPAKWPVSSMDAAYAVGPFACIDIRYGRGGWAGGN